MEVIVLNLIKISAVTVIVGQGLKVIDKTEFKKLVDLCGVTSGLLVVATAMKEYTVKHKESISLLQKIYEWLRYGSIIQG